MDWLTLAANILDRAKRLVPQKVPQPNPETTRVWADWLSKHVQLVVPPAMWVDAVDHWAGHHDGEMLSPQSLMTSLNRVRDQWESSPQKRRMLEELRVERFKQSSLERYGSTDGVPVVEGAVPSLESMEAVKRRFRGGVRRSSNAL